MCSKNWGYNLRDYWYSVDNNYRKHGLASKLIDYVTENLGIKTIFAKTDDNAIKFYKKYGF